MGGAHAPLLFFTGAASWTGTVAALAMQHHDIGHRPLSDCHSRLVRCAATLHTMCLTIFPSCPMRHWPLHHWTPLDPPGCAAAGGRWGRVKRCRQVCMACGVQHRTPACMRLVAGFATAGAFRPARPPPFLGVCVTLTQHTQPRHKPARACARPPTVRVARLAGDPASPDTSASPAPGGPSGMEGRAA